MFIDIHFVGDCEYDPPTTYEVDKLSDVKLQDGWVHIIPSPGTYEGLMAIFNKDVIFSIFPRNK